MKQSHKTIILWILLVGFLVLVANMVTPSASKADEITYDEFLANVKTDQVESITIKDGEYKGVFKDEKKFFFTGPKDDGEKLREILVAHKVKVKFKRKEESGFWEQMIISWLPMILIFLLFFFFMKQLQSGGGKAMSFGKSKANLIEKSKVRFKDVAGIDEAKEELEEVVDFLKNPKKYTKLGGKIPRGVLLVGSPGTGKTLLAKAVAGEADVPFFTISGSDFVEMFVGVGASRVRDLFEQGKKNSPCIIFIDEIDAVGRQRGAGMGGGNDEREQTLNQLLVEMDGFEENSGVILIAATNRPDVLDPALLRPGRFDRQVVVSLPDVRGREQILKIHGANKPLASDIDFSVIARGSAGFSGADLANLLNEAALFAARYNSENITLEYLEKAKDKILMGVERKSMLISDREKLNTSFHESGHALMGHHLQGEDTDPVHKVTIIPRGRALGVTIQLPEEDRLSATVQWCHNRIQILMAGRIAEELSFKNFTTGASNDFKVATNLAHSMVCNWGMSNLGPISYDTDGEVFLGRDMAKRQSYSGETASAIDREIKKIIITNYDIAKKYLTENYDKLYAMSLILMSKETIDNKIIDNIYDGKTAEDILGFSDPVFSLVEQFNVSHKALLES